MNGGDVTGDIGDPSLAGLGRLRIAWADAEMPVLASVRQRFERERPLDGLVVAVCLHVTTETASFVKTLKAGGATVLVCASNPLSTQDDVAASLLGDEGIATFAIRGESHERYYRHIDAVLDGHPQLTVDDGCDLVSRLHQSRPGQLEELIGGTEDTRTGVIRLRAMEAAGVLRYPIVAVNDAAPSICSTTGTGPVSPRSTASSELPTSSSPGRGSSSPATDSPAKELPTGRGEWGRSSP